MCPPCPQGRCSHLQAWIDKKAAFFWGSCNCTLRVGSNRSSRTLKWAVVLLSHAGGQIA